MEPEGPATDQEAPPSVAILKKQWPVVAALAALVVLGIVSFLSRGGDEPEPVASPSTTEQTPITTTPEPEGPLVPPIEACALLESAEIDEALGLAFDDIDGYLSLSRSEGCFWQPLLDGEEVAGLAVEIAPADASDFEDGATLAGVNGTETSGIGDLAMWFGEPSGGVLSVIEETDLGYLLVRVRLERPDMTEDQLLEISRGLAAKVMQRIVFGWEPPVEADLCDLVADEEAEALLAPHREGRAAAREELFVIDDFSEVADLSGEDEFSCTKLILTEIYVSVTTGSIADFEPDAAIEGVQGEAVEGVGEQARWFERVPGSGSFAAPHEVGVLAVQVGNARFRIILSLPDITFADLKGVAIGLGREAVARVSGSTVLQRDDLAGVDLSENGFVDNLLVKEAAGDWTFAEGLVATLRYFAGESDAAEVLNHEELADYSGTGVIALASEYLMTGDDETVKAEIARLLDGLIFIDDRVPFPSVAGRLVVALAGSRVWADLVAQEDDGDDGGYAPPPEDHEIPDEPYPPYEPPDENEAPDQSVFDECSNTEPVLPGWTPSVYTVGELGTWKFVALFPDEGLEGGWNRETHLLWALQALTESLDVYGPTLAPCIHMLFTQGGGSYTYVMDTQSYGMCGIAINRPMQNRSADQFRQQLAADIAHCAIPYNYPKHFETASYLNRRWWNHALAEYLSNVVYPNVNLEWRLNPTLAAQELTVPIVERTAPNWPFFQYLWLEGGYEAVDGMIKALPASTSTLDHEEFLAGLDGMNEFFLRFTQALTDRAVEDSGGGTIPYTPKSEPVAISGRFVSFEEPDPFVPIRLHVQIQPGMYACMKHSKSSEVLASYRSGAPGSGGGWSPLPEAKTPYSGELVLLITSVKPDQTLTLEVVDVSEDDECEEEEEPTPVNTPDLDCVCGPSGYIRFWDQLPDSVQDKLPEPSE